MDGEMEAELTKYDFWVQIRWSEIWKGAIVQQVGAFVDPSSERIHTKLSDILIPKNPFERIMEEHCLPTSLVKEQM